MKQKQGVILLETILSIALFFIILSSTTGVFFKLQERSQRANNQSVALLTLEATKQFLDNNKNLNKLVFSNNRLFYNGDILLEDISRFSMGANLKVTTIDICIDSNKVCTKWNIKN